MTISSPAASLPVAGVPRRTSTASPPYPLRSSSSCRGRRQRRAAPRGGHRRPCTQGHGRHGAAALPVRPPRVPLQRRRARGRPAPRAPALPILLPLHRRRVREARHGAALPRCLLLPLAGAGTTSTAAARVTRGAATPARGATSSRAASASRTSAESSARCAAAGPPWPSRAPSPATKRTPPSPRVRTVSNSLLTWQVFITNTRLLSLVDTNTGAQLRNHFVPSS
jgi:hypothetical protein